MPIERVQPLGSIADLLSGGTPSKSVPTFWGGEIRWLTPKDMGNWTGTTEETVSDSAIGNGTRLAPPEASFVAVRGMSLHNEIRIVRAKEAIAFNQDIKAVVPRPGIHADYLFQVLISKKTELLGLVESAGHGTGRLPTDQLLALEIPRFDQKLELAIAKFIGALDDKIELNRQMNETLEAMARAIFKSWFVDFGPVRAKMEGSATGLTADVAALFPDFMDDESDVPEGWRYATLTELTSELRRGIAPKYIEHGGVCVINQRCIRDRKVSFDASRRHDIEQRAIDGRELQIGDILVNSTGVGTLGRVGQVWTLTETTVADGHVTVVRARDGLSGIYLGQNLLSREVEIEALGEGSTGQTELSRTRLGDLPVLVPSNPVLDAFDKFVSPILKRVAANDEESYALASLRDLLLPKLISGEARIKDAARLVGEAGA